MRKWILSILMFLIIIPIVTPTLCEERLRPGTECTMQTKVILDCESFTYIIKNETGSTVLSGGTLTSQGDGIYNFTFNQSQGNYKVITCDNSSRQIIVEAEKENRMLAIIVGFTIIGAFFFMLGVFIGGLGLKIFNFGVALIQLFNIAYALYIEELGGSLVAMLRLNLIILLLLGTLIGTISLLLWAIKAIDTTQPGEEEIPKWQGPGKWQK